MKLSPYSKAMPGGPVGLVSLIRMVNWTWRPGTGAEEYAGKFAGHPSILSVLLH